MENPLVSICIITYNSSSTILETLDSLYKQTYSPLELIVSDDGSKDDTVKIVKNWFTQKSKRFVNAKLIDNKKNNGVAINLDISIKNSRGKWIKILAGDDLLVPQAIEKFVNATQKTDCQFLVSNLQPFSEEDFDLSKIKNFYDELLKLEKMPLRKKQKLILRRLFVPGPVWFFSRMLYDSVNGINHKYPMMDEWPFIYQVLLNGNDIYVIDECLINYRISVKSLSHKSTDEIPNVQMLIDNVNFFKNVRKKDLLKRKMFLTVFKQQSFYNAQEKMINFYKKTGKVKHYNYIKLSFLTKIKKLFIK